MPQEKNIKHSGNLELEEVIEIARVMRDRSCARALPGTVKEILGTCVSVGCTVNHEDPRELQSKVRRCFLTACLCGRVQDICLRELQGKVGGALCLLFSCLQSRGGGIHSCASALPAFPCLLRRRRGSHCMIP
jgi:hypothetical protein